MKRKTTLKRMLSFLTAIIMMVTAVTFAPVTSSAVSGKYGVLTYEIENGTVAITDCDQNASGRIEIPESIDGYHVTSIGSWSFYGCNSLTSIEIPDGVTSIGYYAFNSCSSLTSIVIPDSVTSIEGGAFYNCDSLTSVIIPNGVTKIDYDTFSGCSNLVSITIPPSVKQIEETSFENCKTLNAVYITDLAAWFQINYYNYSFGYSKSPSKSPFTPNANLYVDKRLVTELVIPNGVKSISDYAFYGYSSIESVTIPKSVTSIGKSAFQDCSSLKELNIGGSSVIGESAFEDCSSLKQLSIGGSSVIRKSAFKNCVALKEINAPKGFSSSEDNAFGGCTALEAVRISDVAAWCATEYSATYSNPLQYAKNLYIDGELATDLVIPEGVSRIGAGAFSNCVNLTTVTIPDSVLTIGSMAFSNCESIINISIPYSVTNIEQNAFGWCKNLRHILYSGSEREWKNVNVNSNDALTKATIHYNSDAEHVVIASSSATCTEAGYNVYLCDVCMDSFMSAVSALGHNFSDEWTVGLEATETEPGVKSRHCLRCDEKTDVTEIPIGTHEHIWGDFEIDKAPTATKPGQKSRHCKSCDEVKDVTPIAPLKPCEEIFEDIRKGAWYVEAVEYAVTYSIFSGMSETRFAPDVAMTRAMLVKVLYNIENVESTKKYTNHFTDVKDGQWYTDAISWAAENGIVYGTTETTFSPDDKISREQLSSILNRYSQKKGYDVTTAVELTSFPDGNKVSSYAKDAIKWAVGVGLISGNKIGGVTMLDAKGDATRAQVATILKNFCEKVAD